MIDKKKRGLEGLSDEDLVRRVLEGDKSLLEVIYDRYMDKIYHKCVGLTKDRSRSKDMAHDIIIKIFMNLHKFKGTSEFSFWVYSITYNHCMSHFKKNKRHREVESSYDDLVSEPLDTAEIELEHKILHDLRLDQLEEMFLELKPEDKIVLLMRYQDGMSVKEMAASLKLGQSAIKMRLKRGRDRLAELLKEMNNGSEQN